MAADLLLLLNGRSNSAGGLDTGLAGAVLLDLALSGHLGLEQGPTPSRKPRFVVNKALAPPTDALLAARLGALPSSEAMKSRVALKAVQNGLRFELVNQLMADGLLEVERVRVLGMFTRSRTHVANLAVLEAVRRPLRDAVVVQLTPTPRTRALIGLLRTVNAQGAVIDRRPADLSRREIRRRSKAIVEAEDSGQAIRLAVLSAVTAVIAADNGGGGG